MMRTIGVMLFGLWVSRADAEIVAHPNVPCPPGEVRIWTAAMQLAVDQNHWFEERANGGKNFSTQRHIGSDRKVPME